MTTVLRSISCVCCVYSLSSRCVDFLVDVLPGAGSSSVWRLFSSFLCCGCHYQYIRHPFLGREKQAPRVCHLQSSNLSWLCLSTLIIRRLSEFTTHSISCKCCTLHRTSLRAIRRMQKRVASADSPPPSLRASRQAKLPLLCYHIVKLPLFLSSQSRRHESKYHRYTYCSTIPSGWSTLG